MESTPESIVVARRGEGWRLEYAGVGEQAQKPGETNYHLGYQKIEGPQKVRSSAYEIRCAGFADGLPLDGCKQMKEMSEVV
jgi:hypothetical protein